MTPSPKPTPLLEDFFRDLDRGYRSAPGHRVRLNVIGSSALMFQTSYHRGTKDADILELPPLDAATTTALHTVAGKHSKLHHRRGIYLDFVRSGVPFLPQLPRWHQASFEPALSRFDVCVLDVVDVVVSKLKRFSSNDMEDIGAVIRLGVVEHTALIARFRAAVDWHASAADADRIPRYVENLHRVERDMLGSEETEFDLDHLHY